MPPKATPEQLEARKEKLRADARRYYHENKERLRLRTLEAYYKGGKRERILKMDEESRQAAEAAAAATLVALEERGFKPAPMVKRGRLEDRCTHSLRAAMAFIDQHIKTPSPS